MDHQKSMFDITKMMSTFDGPSVVEHKKWKARLRVILQVTARAVLEIIDGKQPPGAEATPDQLLAYNRPNGDLYSLLFLLTGGAAHAIIEPFLYHTSTAGAQIDGGGARNGFSGDGRVAWLALEEHFAATTKAAIYDASARLAPRKLGNKEPPEIFLQDMENDREHLRILGDPVSDIRFEDLILRALPPAYDYIRQQQRLNPQFSLKDIKAAILVTYRDWLSRDECSPKITGPGTAMRANVTHIKCH